MCLCVFVAGDAWAPACPATTVAHKEAHCLLFGQFFLTPLFHCLIVCQLWLVVVVVAVGCRRFHCFWLPFPPFFLSLFSSTRSMCIPALTSAAVVAAATTVCFCIVCCTPAPPEPWWPQKTLNTTYPASWVALLSCHISGSRLVFSSCSFDRFEVGPPLSAKLLQSYRLFYCRWPKKSSLAWKWCHHCCCFLINWLNSVESSL